MTTQVLPPASAPRDRLAQLQARSAAGVPLPLLLFYGHHGRGIGPWVLSQWFPAGFTVDGVGYRTAEHWMMAGKARLFGDTAALERVLAAPNPAAAKAAGRAVRGYREQVWAEHRFAVVVDGTRAKFTQHPALAGYLRGTAPLVLAEASPTDRIWGIGVARSDPRAAVPARWPGLNLLGFALMTVRDLLLG